MRTSTTNTARTTTTNTVNAPLVLEQTRGGLYDSSPRVSEIVACIQQLANPEQWDEVVKFYRDRAHEEGLNNVKLTAGYCIQYDVKVQNALKYAEWEEV